MYSPSSYSTRNERHPTAHFPALKPCHSICLISMPSKIAVPDDRLLQTSSFSFQYYWVHWKYRYDLPLSLTVLLAAETKNLAPWIHHLVFEGGFCLFFKQCGNVQHFWESNKNHLPQLSQSQFLCVSMDREILFSKYFTFYFMQQWLFDIKSISF